MGKTFKRIAIDSNGRVQDMITKQRNDIVKNLGITDPRLLSDNKILKVIVRKAEFKRMLSIEEIMRILGR